MKFNSVLSPYGSLVFVLRNFCLSQGHKFFLLCFPQETVIALGFTIQSMAHFDLLLRYVWDKNARLFTHLCMSSVPAAFVEKASLLTHLMKDYYPKGTKNLKCSNKKTTQFFLKKVKRPWHTPHRRAYRWQISTWRGVPHDMSSGNANQNDEIPLQISGMAKIQSADTTEYQARCGATGALAHCWWGCSRFENSRLVSDSTK